jgi:hypothetical protein
MEEEMSTAPKKRMVNGDFRMYARTAMPVGNDPEAPQRDYYDDRIAWWLGKSIYLGSRNSKVSKLFWLLSEHPGRSYRIDEIQMRVDGVVSDASLGVSEEEIRKADQRLRQTLSRLRERLRKADMDDHVFVHREKTSRGPALTMYRRHVNRR